MLKRNFALPFQGLPQFFEGAAFKLSDDEDYKKLIKTVQGLATIVQQQATGYSGIQNQLKAITDRMESGSSKGSGKDSDKDDDDDVDPDNLTGNALVTHVLKQVGSLLDNKLGDIIKTVNETRTEFRTSRVRDDVTKFKGDHKDFDEWADELTALSKQHPTLGVSQLYALAKIEYPDKAKELDVKYTDKKEEPKGELSLFGGFRPSIGKTGGEGGKEDKKMTMDEALEKSWNDAVEQLPALGKMEDALD